MAHQVNTITSILSYIYQNNEGRFLPLDYLAKYLHMDSSQLGKILREFGEYFDTLPVPNDRRKTFPAGYLKTNKYTLEEILSAIDEFLPTLRARHVKELITAAELGEAIAVYRAKHNFQPDQMPVAEDLPSETVQATGKANLNRLLNDDVNNNSVFPPHFILFQPAQEKKELDKAADILLSLKKQN